MKPAIYVWNKVHHYFKIEDIQQSKCFSSVLYRVYASDVVYYLDHRLYNVFDYRIRSWNKGVNRIFTIFLWNRLGAMQKYQHVNHNILANFRKGRIYQYLRNTIHCHYIEFVCATEHDVYWYVFYLFYTWYAFIRERYILILTSHNWLWRSFP